MAINKLIKYMEKSKERVEKERRENPLKRMTDGETLSSKDIKLRSI